MSDNTDALAGSVVDAALAAWFTTDGSFTVRMRAALASRDAEIARVHAAYCHSQQQFLDAQAEITKIRQGEAVALPNCTVADVGFRWDGDKQEHIPQVLVSFTPVPANRPNDDKGWKDRDAFAGMLASPPPAQPAQAEFHNPWRTSLENCISGDNYLRASEYCDLIEELDELYRLRAAQPAPVQPEPVASDVLRPALQQAILALEELDGPGYLIGGVMHYRIGLLLPKLNEALASLASHPPAQPTQAEPVAEAVMDLCQDHQGPVEALAFIPAGTKLYAAQPPREPVQPLSDEDMADCGLLSELRIEEERRAEWHAEMRRDAFWDKT